MIQEGSRHREAEKPNVNYSFKDVSDQVGRRNVLLLRVFKGGVSFMLGKEPIREHRLKKIKSSLMFTYVCYTLRTVPSTYTDYFIIRSIAD